MKIGKYEFNSKEQAKDKIEALGVSEEGYPTHNHCVVELGFIVLEQGQYDEDGVELVAPVLSDKYSVDVLWKELDAHPYGWASYSIDVDGEGFHGFLGLSYQDLKI